MNQINAMRQALEALENLQGLCSEESDFVEQVTIWTPEAIDDLRQAIEQAGKQKIEAIARVDDLERGGRVRALALGLGLDEILYARINHEPN
jgi:glycine/D-amino acid oxidase-like deaminating enzyme